MKYLALLYLAQTNIDPSSLPNVAANKGAVTTIINIVLSIIGGLSLLMITISGFRYITADGDAQKATKAKDGIIYALVGLIVAIFAEAIVAFAGSRISP